jgi:YHS domain-containing protein
MKTLFSILALSAIASFASAAPANTECPVSGKPAKPSVTSTHKGKEVAFCCNNCKGKFDADPAKFEKKIK